MLECLSSMGQSPLGSRFMMGEARSPVTPIALSWAVMSGFFDRSTPIRGRDRYWRVLECRKSLSQFLVWSRRDTGTWVRCVFRGLVRLVLVTESRRIRDGIRCTSQCIQDEIDGVVLNEGENDKIGWKRR